MRDDTIPLAAVTAIAAGTIYGLLTPGAQGNALLLGVTAWVLAWYSYETRRLVKTNQGLVTMQFYPNVILSHNGHIGSDEIVNRGPGPALDLRTSTGEGGGDLAVVCEELPPDIPMSAGSNIIQARGKEYVLLQWRDCLGNPYSCEWRFDATRDQWAPDILSEDGLARNRAERGLPPPLTRL